MTRNQSSLCIAALAALAALGLAGSANAKDSRFMRQCEMQCTGATTLKSCLKRCESERADRARSIQISSVPKDVPKSFVEVVGADGGGNGGGGGRGK